MLDVYATEYDYASAVTHAQALAIQPIARELMAHRLPYVGPHYRPPLATTATSYNASTYAALAFVSHFKLTDRLPFVDAVTNEMKAALERYREDTGANTMITSIFGTQLQDDVST